VQHAILRRGTGHFNLQVAHAASVQKRDLVQEALNTYVTVITGIQQMFEAVINQLLSMILNLRSQIASEIASVRAKVSAQFASIIGCATSQAANILNQIGTLLHQLYCCFHCENW
jgi:hypothetical protein